MRTYRCDACGQILYFENTRCVSCDSTLAFLPDERVLAAVVEDEQGNLRRAKESTFRYRHCQNRIDHAACNWATRSEQDDALCECCRLNEVIPDLSEPRAVELWRRLEAAKRRLLYTLHDLGLSVAEQGSAPPLRFRFMADSPEAEEPIHTGHAAGVITINIAEADDSHREKIREQLGESYRTLLGHFRHESGHLFWDRLVAPDASELARFRQRFGDERADYAAALAAHYEKGPATCPDGFVSAYATMHPWEDWAETWAHYLHLVDTLETSAEYGLTLWKEPRPAGVPHIVRPGRSDHRDFDELIAAWRALSVAMNSLSRSMGQRDACPFALTNGAIEKLRHVHNVIERALQSDRSPAAEPHSALPATNAAGEPAPEARAAG